MIDIASELARLHVLEGAEYSRQIEYIARLAAFHPLEHETGIFAVSVPTGEDCFNLIAAARKAVEHGYHVYILPNPPGVRTADFILERKGLYKMYDLKTIQGQASVGNRLISSVGQANHVILNMTTRYNGGRLAVEIKKHFETNLLAAEIMIFKGKQVFSVKRQQALQKTFVVSFRKKFK